jgi:hypothetical protein
VRVIQSCGQTDFALKPFRPQRYRQLGVEQLQGHRAIVAQVAREVYRGHTAAPQFTLDDVAIAECCYQGGVDCGHQSCRVGIAQIWPGDRPITSARRTGWTGGQSSGAEVELTRASFRTK